MSTSRVTTLMRWVALVPCSVVGGLLAYHLIRVWNTWMVAPYIGLDPDSWLLRAFNEASSHALLGSATVYIAVQIAPAHHYRTQTVFAAALLLTTGFLLFPAVLIRDWWATYSIAWLAIGVGTFLWPSRVVDVTRPPAADGDEDMSAAWRQAELQWIDDTIEKRRAAMNQQSSNSR